MLQEQNVDDALIAVNLPNQDVVNQLQQVAVSNPLGNDEVAVPAIVSESQDLGAHPLFCKWVLPWRPAWFLSYLWEIQCQFLGHIVRPFLVVLDTSILLEEALSQLQTLGIFSLGSKVIGLIKLMNISPWHPLFLV